MILKSGLACRNLLSERGARAVWLPPGQTAPGSLSHAVVALVAAAAVSAAAAAGVVVQAVVVALLEPVAVAVVVAVVAVVASEPRGRRGGAVPVEGEVPCHEDRV